MADYVTMAMDMLAGPFVSMDMDMGLRRLMGHEEDPPSLKDLARLRQFWCGAGRADVWTCADPIASCGEEDDPENAAYTGTLIEQCDTPLAVAVSITLTVDNPTSFVQDPANKLAVESGIAAASGVDAGAVNAILTVARRLTEVQRRLEGGVIVDATIHTADPGAVATLEATVANLDAAAMAGAITTAFQEAGISESVSVTEMGEPEIAPTASAAAASEASANTPRAEDSGTAKVTIASGILVIFAVTLRV